ncbi:MAG: hypothetical protein U1E25_14245 [Methylocystis sp.]
MTRLTQSEYFALGGHGGLQERHWNGIGNFIVNDLKPDENPRLFVKGAYRFLSVLSDLRIGIPAGLCLRPHPDPVAGFDRRGDRAV